MKVIVKRVGKSPEIEEIKDELKTYQKIVGGNIEVFPFVDDILCVCNDEGKLINLPVNFFFFNDYICGDVIFISEKGEDFIGLSDKQIEIIKEMFE